MGDQCAPRQGRSKPGLEKMKLTRSDTYRWTGSHGICDTV
jgi:hypothetical protein